MVRMASPSPMGQNRCSQAPNAIGTKDSSRVASTKGVMKRFKYLPAADARIRSRSETGGQIIIAEETRIGGTKAAMMLNQTSCCHRKEREIGVTATSVNNFAG